MVEEFTELKQNLSSPNRIVGARALTRFVAPRPPSANK
jgi:hypothetical protein